MAAITTLSTVPSSVPSTPSSRPSVVTGRFTGRVTATVVLAVAVLLALAHLVVTPPVGAADVPAVTDHHVVSEGDTMWSIAVEHARAGEAAGYVERLVAVNGGATIEPGQSVALPPR